MDLNTLTSEAAQLLENMISIPSPSFKEDEVCSLISDWMKAKGIDHQRIGNNLIAEHISDPELPTLMLCSHIDTVEPCEGYTFNPYKPENCPADMVQGLGSNDDGASVVSMIAAYRYITDGSFCGDAIQNRATPLAAGGGARDEVVGGVVSGPMLFRSHHPAAEPGLRRAPKTESRLPARQTIPHRLQSRKREPGRHHRPASLPSHRPHPPAPRPLRTYPRSGPPDPRRPPLRRLVSVPDTQYEESPAPACTEHHLQAPDHRRRTYILLPGTLLLMHPDSLNHQNPLSPHRIHISDSNLALKKNRPPRSALHEGRHIHYNVSLQIRLREGFQEIIPF